ncbi:MAG: RNA pseudouridine synthase [Deltaproteobacteria bacterium]|nr:RNA pseudouridine synthase [Deltaproteobacteria bacterium]
MSREQDVEEPRVLAHDARWLVLDKPAWLATTSPDASEPTLARWARRYASGAEIVHPTSRLDVGVTGICVFALTREANEAQLAARAAGTYSRTYVALAGMTTTANPPPRPIDARPLSPQRGERQGEGPTSGASGAWEQSIAVHPRDPRLRAVVEPGRKPRPPVMEARTEWRIVEVTSGVALLALRPRTGRTHQLRVHAAAAGMALLGDAAYGGLRRVTLADGTVIGLRRPALHCARVRIDCAGDIGTLDVAAAVPADLRDPWRALGGRDDAWDDARGGQPLRA